MYTIDFNNPCHIYFIGIGGISMSGLAELLFTKGFRISGSDWHSSPITKRLEGMGISIQYGESASHIGDDIDYAVLTSAVQDSNVEFQAVKAKQIPYMLRADLLGQIMKNFGMPIAISGTHGKTTTTSMVSEILLTRISVILRQHCSVATSSLILKSFFFISRISIITPTKIAIRETKKIISHGVIGKPKTVD